MKTLADVKRRAQVGVKVELRYADDFPLLTRKGNPPVRKIAIVQGKSIAFEGTNWSGGRESWLEWPKASEVRIVGPDSFEIAGMGVYTFLPS